MLQARIAQLTADADRETALNSDAGETLAKAKASTTPWTQPPRKPTKPPASFITAKTICPL
jgi:hypothetical protein